MNHLPTTTASKLALSVALQHGFIAVLVFALIALIATFFLKEKLITAIMATQKQEESVEAECVAQKDEESDKELVHA